jgi:hypothetical protein
MPVPTVPLGNSHAHLAAWRRGALVLGVALLLGPAATPQAAPGAPSAPVSPPPALTLRPQVASLLSQPDTQLRALLEDTHTEPPMRANAATALSLQAGTEAIPTLLPYLQDRDSQVRIAVARALGRLGGPEVQQALEERIPSEEEPLVREALQQGLSFIEP